MVIRNIIRLIATLMVLLGLSLSLINFYGLTQSIRPAGLMDEPMRFENDLSLTYEEALSQLARLPDESELAFASRITTVIAQGIGHIHWIKTEDTHKYHQLIPIWENYFLYAMGLFSGIPEYKKYHFMDYKRSLKRGIGVCGDTSMIMSQVLDKHGIQNDILVMPEHVLVRATVDGQEQLFDADYGIHVPMSPEQARGKLDTVVELYAPQLYSHYDKEVIRKIFSGDYTPFHGVTHFATKKYYFEMAAYWLKWPLPLFLLAMGLWLLRKRL